MPPPPAVTGRPARFHSGNPSIESSGPIAPAAQLADGVVGKDAVRAAAVRDDVGVLGQRAKLAFELTDRNRSGAGDVPGRVLGFGPHVEQQHLAALQASGQLRAVDELDPVPIAEVGRGEPLEAGDMFGGDVAQRRPQVTDPVAGQRVEDPGAVPTCGQEPGAGHGPKVVRGVGDGLADLVGDVVDRPLTLGEHIDDLGPAPAGQGLGDLGEPLVQRVLGDPVTHALHRCSGKPRLSSIQTNS